MKLSYRILNLIIDNNPQIAGFLFQQDDGPATFYTTYLNIPEIQQGQISNIKASSLKKTENHKAYLTDTKIVFIPDEHSINWSPELLFTCILDNEKEVNLIKIPIMADRIIINKSKLNLLQTLKQLDIKIKNNTKTGPIGPPGAPGPTGPPGVSTSTKPISINNGNIKLVFDNDVLEVIDNKLSLKESGVDFDSIPDGTIFKKSHNDFSDTEKANASTAYTHSQTTTGNPHSVSASDLGSSTAQWNADKIQGVTVDDTDIADGKVLQYNSTSTNLEYVTPSTSSLPPGVIVPYGAAAAPAGWLLCDGSTVNRTTYSDLFAVISTTFGVGDGSTTFNLPDLRGRVVIALDNLGGSSADVVTDADADALGGTDGAETHTLTESEMPSHTHAQYSHHHGTGQSNDFLTGSVLCSYDAGTGEYKASSKVQYTGSTTAVNQNTGGDGSHNNMQPWMALAYIIKT